MTINVTGYLEQTARQFPDKVAFADENNSLTFSELRNSGRHIAMGLIDREIFKCPVVVFMGKTPMCIAAFVGVAYSGNYYTPVDTEMPLPRIQKIMETLDPVVVLTDKSNVETVRLFSTKADILLYEDLQNTSINDLKLDDVNEKVTDSDVLYVLFTSGSTGIPKGVVISHRSVLDYIDWFVDKFLITPEDKLGNQAPLHFDLSIQDVYAPLKVGCTAYLIEKDKFAFPIKLMEYLAQNHINVIMWVPSALCLVANLKALRARILPELRLVLFCGEVMPNKQLNQWRSVMPNTIFVNLYGPSESCDASTYYIVDREFADDEVLPIGYPCRNTDIFVLNESNNLVKDDEIGELCIRGTGLAYGYYRETEKTAEAFVQNPLNTSYPEIIYRTGDLVRYNDLGELVYVGRKDFQIKHMGHRIELGEIEAAVYSLEGIECCCCLYDMKRSKIVLFYTGDADSHWILEQLRALVPEYMIPNRKIHLDDMPMNLNGKVDRVVLKEKL